MTVANLAVLEADICYLTEQRYAGHDQANALQSPKTEKKRVGSLGVPSAFPSGATLANGNLVAVLNGQK